MATAIISTETNAGFERFNPRFFPSTQKTTSRKGTGASSAGLTRHVAPQNNPTSAQRDNRSEFARGRDIRKPTVNSSAERHVSQTSSGITAPDRKKAQSHAPSAAVEIGRASCRESRTTCAEVL